MWKFENLNFCDGPSTSIWMSFTLDTPRSGWSKTFDLDLLVTLAFLYNRICTISCRFECHLRTLQFPHHLFHNGHQLIFGPGNMNKKSWFNLKVKLTQQSHFSLLWQIKWFIYYKVLTVFSNMRTLSLAVGPGVFGRLFFSLKWHWENPTDPDPFCAARPEVTGAPCVPL